MLYPKLTREGEHKILHDVIMEAFGGYSTDDDYYIVIEKGSVRIVEVENE